MAHLVNKKLIKSRNDCGLSTFMCARQGFSLHIYLHVISIITFLKSTLVRWMWFDIRKSPVIYMIDFTFILVK
jgi:hypothetical protein